MPERARIIGCRLPRVNLARNSILLAAVGLALLLASAATAQPPNSPPPRWAVAILPSGDEFSLEIAATDEAREQGYMFREKVDPREGMLFLFDRPGYPAFWMQNCRVRLDIVWLDESFRVVDIAADQPPCVAGRECPLVTPREASRYVLEFAGGTAKAKKLAVGDRIVILSEPPIR